MCREPRYVNPDDDIRVALTIMVEQQIRHLPVVDAHDMLVGIVSDRDLRAAVGDPIEALRDDDDDNLVPFYIADVMTANPISIKPDAPLADLSWSLLDEKVGAVPVVDDDDHLVGIVSYVDVLHFALRGLP
jgi:acetoin utilization protein AcuB